MDFDFAPEDEAFRAEVRDFIAEHYTPEMRAAAEEIYARYTIGWLYDPPTVAIANQSLGTLQLPSSG